MKVTVIELAKIALPSSAEGKVYPDRVIEEMASEIKEQGWPKGKELGVKMLNGGFEVHASFAWFKAGILSGIKEVPCVIY